MVCYSVCMSGIVCMRVYVCVCDDANDIDSGHDYKDDDDNDDIACTRLCVCTV